MPSGPSGAKTLEQTRAQQPTKDPTRSNQSSGQVVKSIPERFMRVGSEFFRPRTPPTTSNQNDKSFLLTAEID